jgi:tetratricopeptide (TPR) repeat protein
VLGVYYAFGQGRIIFVQNQLATRSFMVRIFTAFKIFYLYVQKLIFPVNLSSDYFFNQLKVVPNPLASPEAIIGFLLLLSLLYLAFSNRFRSSNFALGAVWFLGAYILISNFFILTTAIMGERFMYFPSVGYVIIVSALTAPLIQKKYFKCILPSLASLILIFYGYIIVTKNRVWLNQGNLVADMVKTSPESVNALGVAAVTYLASGQVELARSEAEKALAIYPFFMAEDVMGILASDDKEYAKAETYFKNSIKDNPIPIRPYSYLGHLYYEEGRFDDALFILNYAVRAAHYENDVLVYALTLIRLQRYNDAREVIIKYYGYKPENQKLKLALGLSYLRAGDSETAWKYFNQVRNPKYTDQEFLQILDSQLQ